MSNTVPIQYDAESEAYLQRFPELRPLLTLYGPQGPRLHYENFGKNQGLTWGLNAPTQAGPATPPETVSTAPLPALYGNDAAGWDAWMNAGRRAAEGVNQMPGVFSDYGSLPTDDAAARALFYPGSAPASTSSGMSAPNGIAAATPMSGISALAGTASAPVPGNAMQSGGSLFDRITAAGPEAYAAPLIDVVSHRGGMSPEEIGEYLKGQEYFHGR